MTRYHQQKDALTMVCASFFVGNLQVSSNVSRYPQGLSASVADCNLSSEVIETDVLIVHT